MTGASWLLMGGAVGTINGLTLWRAVARLRPTAPRRTVAWVTGSALLRWSLVTGLLTYALQHGILPGLLAFAGLWLVRWAMVCWLECRPPSPNLLGD